MCQRLLVLGLASVSWLPVADQSEARSKKMVGFQVRHHLFFELLQFPESHDWMTVD